MIHILRFRHLPYTQIVPTEVTSTEKKSYICYSLVKISARSIRMSLSSCLLLRNKRAHKVKISPIFLILVYLKFIPCTFHALQLYNFKIITGF